MSLHKAAKMNWGVFYDITSGGRVEIGYFI